MHVLDGAPQPWHRRSAPMPQVSGRVKALAKALEGARAEAAGLAVQQEHLRRQQDIFAERIASAKEQVRRSPAASSCSAGPCMRPGPPAALFACATEAWGSCSCHRWMRVQWKHKRAAAQSAVVEQQRCKEAVEADNAANNAALAENLAKARRLALADGHARASTGSDLI